MVGLGSLVWWASVSVSGGCCVVVGSGGGGRRAKPRVGGCALCWVGLGSVVVGLGSLVWWASVSVSGGCCVVVGGGGGGRGAKPRVGGCALGVGKCVFRGLGQDFAKMVNFWPSENLENNSRQHVVLVEYLPTRYCFVFREALALLDGAISGLVVLLEISPSTFAGRWPYLMALYQGLSYSSRDFTVYSP